MSPDRETRLEAWPAKVTRLLFVTDVYPYPMDRGDRIRILNLLQACAQVHEVTLVVAKPEAASLQHIPQCVSRVVLVDLQDSSPIRLRHYLHAIRSSIGLPFLTMVRYRARFLQAMENLDLLSFNVIWCERPHLGSLFLRDRKCTIVDLDDVEHLRTRLLIGLQRPSLAIAHTIYTYLVYRYAELRQFRGFLRLVVCSQSDHDYLTKKHAGRVAVVPNGADIPPRIHPPRTRLAGTPLRAVFLGNMGHAPNDDAVRYFADQVLPWARGIIASLDVIGPNPSDALRRDYSDRVTFRGFVADLTTALGDYDVMVAPIRFGSGTKLKLIESMANKLVFVASPCAAAGLDLVHDTHGLLADKPAQILECLTRLVHSPQLCEQLATQAFLHACERFSWDSIQGTLAAQLRQL